MKYLRILKPDLSERAKVTRGVILGVTKAGVKSKAPAAQNKKTTHGRTTSSAKGVFDGFPKPAKVRKAQVTALSTTPKANETEKARTKLCVTIFSEPKTPAKLLSARQEPERWWLVTKSFTARPDQIVLTLWSKDHVQIEIPLVGKDPFRIFLYEERTLCSNH